MGARGDFGLHWLGITWSLAVEEQFYLFGPLLVYFLPRRMLFAVLLLAILAAPILRCAAGGFNAYVNTPCRADSLLSGAELAVLVRWYAFMSAVHQQRRLLLMLFVALIAGCGVMTLRPAGFGEFNHFWLAGLYAVFVLMAFAGIEPYMGGLLRLPILVWFGKLSYGIYIFHEIVNGFLHAALAHGAPQIRTLADAGNTVFALCVTLFLATLSYRLLETPILQFGHRFQYSPKPTENTSFQPVPNLI
jgi:peptidoglycan/LPS O-acetylase OafA/YrhL